MLGSVDWFDNEMFGEAQDQVLSFLMAFRMTSGCFPGDYPHRSCSGEGCYRPDKATAAPLHCALGDGDPESSSLGRYKLCSFAPLPFADHLGVSLCSCWPHFKCPGFLLFSQALTSTSSPKPVFRHSYGGCFSFTPEPRVGSPCRGLALNFPCDSGGGQSSALG